MIIERERPDAILPTVGGQTALNLAVQLDELGVLKKYGVELIGAQIPAIKVAEDRLLFRDAMNEIGISVPASGVAKSLDEALKIVERTGFPAIIRPSFTMGGVGGGIRVQPGRVQRDRRPRNAPRPRPRGPRRRVGDRWKEFELEVMRDGADNFVVICSIANIDAMGVHTGDSITVAPALTLTDKEYQRMRDAARRIIRRVGVETGGSNIQFAINPDDGRMVAIEMNPRVSRSRRWPRRPPDFRSRRLPPSSRSVIASTRSPTTSPGSRPRRSSRPSTTWSSRSRAGTSKFPQADRTLTTQMKSVGEAMAIGRTFKEAFLKGVRSLELGKEGLLFKRAVSSDTTAEVGLNGEEESTLRRQLVIPTDRRMWALFTALDKGWDIEQLHELTHIDPWFLQQFKDLVELRRTAEMVGLRDMSYDLMRTLKRAGFGDRELAEILGVDEAAVREKRQELKIRTSFKRIDTCAAEFESFTPYLYSSFEDACEADPTDKQKVIILGSGPNRIGQGIEFDYCCCHAVFGFKREGFETVMVNCNPETVSTDYDTSDQLYLSR